MKVLIDSVSILSKMHSLSFVHRDIKSSNILIGADGKYKLSDFNTSKILEGSTGAPTLAGTLEYTSPEIVSGEEYSFPTDIYSIGVVLYQMMMGKTPFVNDRGVVALKDLMAGKYVRMSSTCGYSQAIIDLVHACLSLNPLDRPTASQILASPLVARVQETKALYTAMQLAVVVEVEKRTEEVRREMESMKEREREMEREMDEMRKKEREMGREMEGMKQREKEMKKEMEEMRKVVEKVKGEMEEMNEKVKKKMMQPPNLMAIKEYPIVFFPKTPPPHALYTGTTVSTGDKLGPYTVGIECDLSSQQGGIFLLNVAVSGDGGVGLASKSNFPSQHSTWLHKSKCRNTCCLSYAGLSVGQNQVLSNPFDRSSVLKLICLELNQANHTLHFFVNGKQIPHCVIDVPEDVSFAVSIYSYKLDARMEVRTLRSVPASTTDPSLVCTNYSWNK